MFQGADDLLAYVKENDVETIVETCYSLGFLAEGNDAERLAKQLVNALHKFLKNEAKIDSLDFKNINVDPFNNSIFDLIKEVGLKGLSGSVQIPKDYVLLNRMVTLLMGICSALDSKMNPLDVVRPYVKEFVLGEQESMLTFVTGLLRRTMATTLGLPDELHRVLHQMQNGEIDFRSSDIRDSVRVLYLIGSQVIFAALSIASGILGYGLYKAGDTRPAQAVFLLSGVCLLLLFSAMRAGNRVVKKME